MIPVPVKMASAQPLRHYTVDKVVDMLDVSGSQSDIDSGKNHLCLRFSKQASAPDRSPSVHCQCHFKTSVSLSHLSVVRSE